VENTALGMGVALFLLGLGWSFCYLSASALLASGASLAERARVQGTADLINWMVAAAGALGGGILVGRSGFPLVAAVGAVASLVPLVSAAWLSRHEARG
jgi:predicted MFS family arabinose efflux permease